MVVADGEVAGLPRLSIAADFMEGYGNLQSPVRRAVDRALSKFTQHTHAGLHLEKLAGAMDPRIRTIRITDFWRGVVLAEGGEAYTLLRVMPHDEANRYATSRRFSVNQAIGVLEVRDQKALDDLTPALRAAAGTDTRPLFDHIKDGELTALGVDVDVLPLVRLITSEAHLPALERILPRPQYDALVGLASGLSPEEVWAELAGYLGDDDPPAEIDPTDLSAAIHRTPDQYVTISGPDELADVLAHPFAAWRRFLHSRQKAIAYRPSFRGPALVTGGAGTGKTVTAVHRAAFLAGRAGAGHHREILFTTFTNNLVDALNEQLALLIEDHRVRERLDVITVNKLAYRIVAQTGQPPQIIEQSALGHLWKSAANRIGNAFSPAFLQREWEQVILAQDLPDRDAYLGCRRSGRGRKISAAQREQVWTAIAYVLGELRASGQRTHHQVVADAAGILAERARPPYRHVLVDEGQDLHPVQWRLLRNAVASGPDDLFIVSDPNQRIYDNRVSLASLGIEVRGRSRRLALSYRTTQEILNWSVRVLDRSGTTGLDDQPDTLAGYRSQTHGRQPVVRSFPDWWTELDGLIDQIRGWLDAGVEPSAIGIAVRTTYRVKDVREALDRTSIANAEKETERAVRVGTMHGMKGLEFRCVAVIGVDEGTVPAPAAVTAFAEDPAAHEQDTQRERCLLFVACTRARDVLYISHSTNPSRFLHG